MLQKSPGIKSRARLELMGSGQLRGGGGRDKSGKPYCVIWSGINLENICSAPPGLRLNMKATSNKLFLSSDFAETIFF